ncbi:hypothetical protein HZY88_03405 [Aerococcaceae bacterium DSM 111176]|nr:hypothetical protein [Aerococcaceae bacterium DSM 111176]
MEPKKKNIRWGRIIGIIFIALLIPFLIYFSPMIFWFFWAMSFPEPSDVRRQANTIMTRFENNPIDDDEEFVERYIDLADYIVDVQGYAAQIPPHIKMPDVYELLGEPSNRSSHYNYSSSERIIEHIYDYYPYVGIIEESRSNNVHLDYYTEIYYTPEELNDLFYLAVNEYRGKRFSHGMTWIESNQPSMLRQSTKLKDTYTGEVLYLTSEDLDDPENLTMPAFNSMFDYQTDLSLMGKLEEPTLEIRRSFDIEPNRIDPEIYQQVYEESDDQIILNVLGDTVVEISDTLKSDPNLLHFDGEEPETLNVSWQQVNVNYVFTITAQINFEEDGEVTPEFVQQSSIESIYTR